MILPLFRRSPKRTIAALYGAIVAQARAARSSTQAYGVPDTVLGRFDLIVLHLVLLLRRLRAGEAAHRALAQGVFDAFCRDMDHNLREMGISDQGVPRQMRRVGEAFYGRAQAYEAALARAGRRCTGGGARPQRLRRATEPQVAAVTLADLCAAGGGACWPARRSAAWRRRRAFPCRSRSRCGRGGVTR